MRESTRGPTAIVFSGSSKLGHNALPFDVSFLEYTKLYGIIQRQDRRRNQSSRRQVEAFRGNRKSSTAKSLPTSQTQLSRSCGTGCARFVWSPALLPKHIVQRDAAVPQHDDSRSKRGVDQQQTSVCIFACRLISLPPEVGVNKQAKGMLGCPIWRGIQPVLGGGDGDASVDYETTWASYNKMSNTGQRRSKRRLVW